MIFAQNDIKSVKSTFAFFGVDSSFEDIKIYSIYTRIMHINLKKRGSLRKSESDNSKAAVYSEFILVIF